MKKLIATIKKITAKVDLDELADNSRGFPDEFLSKLKKAAFIFVHKYPNADKALMGGDLIARAKLIQNYKDELLVIESKGLTEDEHIFLSLPGWKKLAKGYVEKIAENKAYVSGMGSDTIQ